MFLWLFFFIFHLRGFVDEGNLQLLSTPCQLSAFYFHASLFFFFFLVVVYFFSADYNSSSSVLDLNEQRKQSVTSEQTLCNGGKFLKLLSRCFFRNLKGFWSFEFTAHFILTN